MPAFATPLSATRPRASHVTRQLCNLRRSYLFREEARIAEHAVQWGARATPTRRADTVCAQDAPHAEEGKAGRLDGKATAATIRGEIAADVAAIVGAHGEQSRPGLAVVIVGERPDSMTYVRAKRKACAEVGLHSVGFELAADVTQEEVERIVQELNDRADVHGILVQLPLPAHIDEEQVLDRISVHKDVDGFHPLNIGRVCMSGRTPPLAIPCTPKACIELLDRYHIELQGRKAVVIGRSNIVGLPVAMLLMHRNATVTICHSRTVGTETYVRDADIVIAACGIAQFVRKEWLKPGAVVVDVGINAVDDATKKKGYRLVGDVDFEGAQDVASWISPVPGGVGPMTIAMLLQNTLAAAKRQLKL